MNNLWRFITTIAKKEIIEFVREWRILIALIVIPLLIFLTLFIVLPLLLQSEAAELDELELDVILQRDINEDLGKAFNEPLLDLTFEAMPSGLSNLSNTGGDDDRL